MTIWITGDTHFYHKNIIKYCNRPFADVEEMNEALVANHNYVVKPEDFVYHVGDFSFDKSTSRLEWLTRRLNGHKTLILGNHDYLQDYSPYGWDHTHRYLELKVQGYPPITLFHYAMKVWNRSHHGAWQLYGHSHGSLADDPNSLSIDVGVDCHGYRPICLEEIRSIMAKKTWRPVDHHGNREV